MIGRFILIGLGMLLFGNAVFAQDSGPSWRARFHLEGQDLGVVKEYEVVIGVGPKSELLPSPPPPPEYSARMELISRPNWQAAYKDIREPGRDVYFWILAIDPHGNVGSPYARKARLSWCPSEFGEGDLELRRGYDENGEVLVRDMMASSSYDLEGTGETHYVTVVYAP